MRGEGGKGTECSGPRVRPRVRKPFMGRSGVQVACVTFRVLSAATL